MGGNHSQKFNCYGCNKETIGVISDIQTSHGINQCIICTNCFNAISLSLLGKINERVDELINKASEEKIDLSTKFAIGSKEYNDIYYSKIDDESMHM